MSDDMRLALVRSAVRYGLYCDHEKRSVSLPKLNLPPHVEDDEATETVAGRRLSPGHGSSGQV
jgi:hypothetical protein